MRLIVHNDDGSKTIHNFDDILNNTKNDIDIINSTHKEINALSIISNYKQDKKTILFDSTNKIIEEKLLNTNLDIFKEYEFISMFFTSGSTGQSVGALKTKQNLEDEIKSFSELIKKYNIKQVIVTVPFIHIYGTLIGLLYPYLNGIDIVLKEHFLPHNLLEIIDDYSLVVTTPLYIKALNKVQDSKDLNKSLILSSTAPLHNDDANEFCKKFNTNIIQLFGSTETSGIAYKYNDDNKWSPLDNVNISTNEQNELIVKSPFVSKYLYEDKFIQTNGVIQTFDYIEREGDKFKLVGRSSKILKIAGKRYSTVQIESILEDIEQINKALVFVKKDNKNMKDEVVDITLEASKQFTSLEIKKIIKSKLSNLKFSINLHYVDKISVNEIGKKLII